MFKSLSTSLIWRGILAVAVGIMALAWPQVTVLALVILFAVYAFIAAGLEAVRAFSSREAGPVFGHLLLGLVDLAAGVVALAWPGPTALVLVLDRGHLGGHRRHRGDRRRLRRGRAGRDAGAVHPGRAGVDRVRRGAVRPPGRGRGHPGAAVRPVQPGLRRPGAGAGHRAAPDPARPSTPPSRKRRRRRPDPMARPPQAAAAERPQAACAVRCRIYGAAVRHPIGRAAGPVSSRHPGASPSARLHFPCPRPPGSQDKLSDHPCDILSILSSSSEGMADCPSRPRSFTCRGDGRQRW